MSTQQNDSTKQLKTTADIVAKSQAQNAAQTALNNKFLPVNINSQFKGKSIEPQHKTNLIRPTPTGMQTLGKAVAARRMPPPAYLPSLAKSTGVTISSTSNQQEQQQQQQQTNQSDQLTIAAVVSGNTTWPTPNDSNTSQSPDIDSNQQQQYKSYSNTTKWGQNEFPKLEDAAQQPQQQQQPIQPQQLQKPKPDQQVQQPTTSGPVLKPSNVGNWGTTTNRVIQSDDIIEPAPINELKQEPQYQPRPQQQQQQMRPNIISSNYRGKNPNYNQNRKYNTNYYNNYNQSNESYNIPSIVKEKDFTHLDDLTQQNNQLKRNEHSDDVNQEENWAYINQNVDYNEKIQFLDEEEEQQPQNEPEPEPIKQDTEETNWNEKRKLTDDEVKNSIERARLRRAEEERRLSEQRQAVCAEKLRQLNLKKTVIEQPIIEPIIQEQEEDKTNGSSAISSSSSMRSNTKSPNNQQEPKTTQYKIGQNAIFIPRMPLIPSAICVPEIAVLSLGLQKHLTSLKFLSFKGYQFLFEQN